MQALFRTVGKILIEKAAPLYAKTMKEKKKQEAGKDPEPGTNWDAGSIIGLFVAPVLALLCEIAATKGVEKYVRTRIGKTNKRLNVTDFKNIIDCARYMVMCIDEGTMVYQTTSQLKLLKGWGDYKHIAIVAGDPGAKTLLFSENDTHIVAGKDIYIEAVEDAIINALNATIGADEEAVVSGNIIKFITPKREDIEAIPNILIDNNKTITIQIKNTKIKVMDKEITVEAGDGAVKSLFELKENEVKMKVEDNIISMNEKNVSVISSKSKIKVEDEKIKIEAPKEVKMGPIRTDNRKGRVFIN